jgi:hypothetical protein
MDEQGITLLVGTAFEVGRSLLNFCDGNTSVDRDLANFADHVNAYASAWSLSTWPSTPRSRASSGLSITRLLSRPQHLRDLV